MLILRVAHGIREHLPARAAEWALGVILFNWGWILLLPSVTFARPAYEQLLAVAPEWLWGLGCALAGLTRLVALVVNGTFADSGYSRFSPHVRAAVAAVSIFFWLQITLSIVAAGTVGTGLAVYPVLLCLDIYSVFRAARDAKSSDEAARDGPDR